MKKTVLIITIALLLGASLAVRAQDGVARGKEIENSLRAKNAKRKLKESIPAGTHAEQEWSLDGKRVLVNIYEFNSPEEAARHMELAIKGIAYAQVRERLPNLGDDAYVSTDRRGTSTSLALRRGKVYVVINASSLKVAKEFARDIADHLAKK